jgi:1-acyl-sn-glycerol-3-phosphate acyltransferase
MTTKSPKPTSPFKYTNKVQLPVLSRGRQLLRWLVNSLVRIIVRLSTRATVSGLANVPQAGSVLLVANHLGDIDDLLKIAFLPRQIEAIAKVDFLDFPFLGRLLDAYGVIWIRRGQPDRQALRAALHGLAVGRLVMINPEGRESLSGAMEEATHGAAFLALKSNAPILPLAITGTQNSLFYANLRRLRRTSVTFRVGEPFYLATGPAPDIPANKDRQQVIEQGTQTIMIKIAVLLPQENRGFYQ